MRGGAGEVWFVLWWKLSRQVFAATCTSRGCLAASYRRLKMFSAHGI